jgi:plasmid stabilization system protein ParE
MAIKQIEFAPEFEKDLEDIFNRMKDISSVHKAQDFIDKVFDKIEFLREFPYLGQKEVFIKKARDLDYRYLVVEDCKILYRVINDMILVAYIFDTRQNPKKLKIKK